MTAEKNEYRGLLFIGDPHLEGRVPGFRKDNYPEVVIAKLRWCLNYAAKNRLLPAILGDLFHRPRDNPNWMIVELIQMLDQRVVTIYGNHDVHENQINEHDSLNILLESGHLELLDEDHLVETVIGDTDVALGGTSWKKPLPESFPKAEVEDRLVVWMTHHDIGVPGYQTPNHLVPTEISGIDIVVNGHIHRRLDRYQTGATVWLTPGNISRRKRSDAAERHVPSVLRVDIEAGKWRESFVEVPHRPFHEVFHEAVIDKTVATDPSAFVAGLAELESRKTDTAEGLYVFLEKNLQQFDAEVATEIQNLAKEVTADVRE